MTHKLYLCLIRQAVMVYVGVEIYLHAFLTSALDYWDEWSASRLEFNE
jgi:hypothetical protein